MWNEWCHSYCNNHVFLHNFAQTDVSEFWIWFAKMWYFLYYIRIDMSAQVFRKKKGWGRGRGRGKQGAPYALWGLRQRLKWVI